MSFANQLGAVEIVRTEFLKMRAKNKQYSLRSFAAKTGISSGRLSEIFSGKRTLTYEVGKKVSTSLRFSKEKSERFLSAIEAERIFGKDCDFKKRRVQSSMRLLKEDQFAFMSEWYHAAILSLLETDDFQSDPVWISRRLGLQAAEVVPAIDRLQRLGLITRQDDGSVRASSCFITTEDVPSAALRESHRQTLMQVVDALDAVPVELREITTVSFCTTLEKLDMAKAAIRRFRDELANLLESGTKSEVYNLNIQLVPVTRLRR
jgi:uncharacterized protein (TIGR02147 family)